MKRQTLLKSTLCLLMALLCNVTWAQTSYFKMGTSTTSLSDGNYVLVAMSDKGTGPVLYELNAGEGKHYRYEAGKTFAAGDVVSSKYVWTIDETTVDGVQHITVTNYDDNTKAFPVDGARNLNFTGSGTASLKTEMYTAGGVGYIVLTLDDDAIGYVHANAPGGNPCLSYWPTNGDGASCVKFTFYPVEALTDAELADRLTYNISDGNYNNRTDNSSSSWRPGWTSTNVGKPSFTITAANNKNNMNAGSTEFIGMRPGDTKSCVYTLTLGETFTGYSFEAKSTNTAPDTNNPAHVITINGEQTTVGTEWTTFKVDACGTSTTFTLTGSNGHDLYIRNIKFEQDADAAATAAAAATANANLNIYGLQRHLGLVQNADKYECNYPSNPVDGNGYPGLLDGNYTTFFHSGYDGHNPGPSGVAHYLQADLGKAVKSFRFYFKKRSQNNANRPTKITIEGSNDKETWALVTVIASGFPTNENVLDYYSEAITIETAYQHYRFTVNSTSGGTRFFTFSEFYILPNISKVAETFDAVRNYRAGVTVSAATVLNEVYAWNTALTNAMPIVGADHFFFADTKQSDNSYVARYLYNNNGALATSTSLNVKDTKYMWTAAQPEGTEYYTLQNKGDNTKYISYGNNGNGWWVGTAAVQLDIKSNEAVHTGSVGIKRIGTDGNGKYMVTAADGSSFNRNSGKVNSGSWCSDYVFIPADLYEGLNALTIVSNTSKANAVFTWNENEAVAGSSILFFSSDGVADGTLRVKSCNPTYKLEGFYSDAAYTQKITEVTELPADMTVYAKFVLDIFSESYGDKWVNIVRKTNANHAIILGSDAEGANPIFNTLNYTNAGMVWSFVGTAENFKIYNKVSGEGLALTPGATSIGDGTTVKMVAKDNAQSWHLIEKGEAFAIAPVGNNDKGINSYGGDNALGSQIKFYGVNDGGTQWYFTAIDASKPLTLSVSVTGEQPYATTNTRVADLNTTINGATSSTVVKGNVGALTYYLPVGATFTLSNSYIYRGYIFDGFLDAEGNAAEYTNATIPEGGLNITAKYSVDEDNKYQYLFYCRDDVHNKPYRIPAIATASNNTVLAFSDYRPCSNDIGYGEVDIMLRRSYDNGETWSAPVCIADGQGGNSNVFNVGFGDAAVVADRESGKVLVMAVAGKQVFGSGSATGHNSMAKIVSNDNGESWNAPEDVTSQFMIDENSLFPKAYTMFFGSGRMLQSRVYKAEGADYYRIYGALLIKHPSDTYTGNCNYVVYSDDFGATWKILGGSIAAGMCCNGGDEPKVEELPDGSIVLSSRKGSGRYFNVFTYTDKATGAGLWGDVTTGVDNNGQATNGEIYKVKAIRKEDGKICDVMLQSIPAGSGRSNVTVYYKEMDYTSPVTSATFASAWPVGMLVSNMGSAYSTMILQADGNFGFFYEELPGDNYAYCMVYVPLSLEEMTDNKYSLYTVNSTIGEYKIGTFYASEAVQIPEGVKAYVATEEPVMENGAGVITMTELEGIIPAHTGAVLRGDAATYNFIPSISYGTAVENNMLVGFEGNNKDARLYREEALVEGYTTYVLTNKLSAEEYVPVGFYKKEADFKVYNNKAYLQVPAAVSANALRIRIEGEQDDYATEIVMPVANGQQPTAIYDLTGRRVQKVQKGLYIVNGKKVWK